MGFFDFLKTDNEEDDIKWNFLSSEEDVQTVIESSQNKTQVIFKHSPSCAVSFFARKSLDSEEILDSSEFDFHTIDVINERSLSKKFTELTGVRHESPQIIVLKNKEVIWHDSHTAVNLENVLTAINSD